MSASQRATMLPPGVRNTFAEPGDGTGDGTGDGAGDGEPAGDDGAAAAAAGRVAASSDERSASTLPIPNALIAAVHMVLAPIAKTHRPPRMGPALPGAWEST